MRGIANDEFNIDMTQSREEKDEAIKAKASKTWRTLRLSSRSKLALFDKIEDGNNLKVLFEPPPMQEDTPAAANKQKSTMENGVNDQEGSSRKADVKMEEAKENQRPVSSNGPAPQQG